MTERLCGKCGAYWDCGCTLPVEELNQAIDDLLSRRLPALDATERAVALGKQIRDAKLKATDISEYRERNWKNG